MPRSIAKNFAVRLATLLAGAWLTTPMMAFELEMAPVTVNDTSGGGGWTSVSFIQSFDTVPHVYVLPTTDGTDPATLRIRNVTAAGFEVVQTEPSANDGPHAAMSTAYLAIEPGAHTLPGGVRIVSSSYTTTSFANRFISTTWDNRAFPATFSATPAVLAMVQGLSNETGNPPATSSIPFLEAGVRNVGPGGLQLTLERAESTAGTVTSPERIAYLGIDAGANVSFVDSLSNSIQLQSLLTPRNIRGFDNGCFVNSYGAAFPGTPLSVASMNTRFGNNGGWLRRCSESAAGIGLTVDEDIDTDSERNHITEVAGVVAASAAFHANFDVDLDVSKSIDVLSDLVGRPTGPRAVPSSTIEYTIEVENLGSISPDVDTLVVTDTIPSDLSLCVTVACYPGGPVIFDDSASPVPTGVTLGLVEYSDDGGATYTYVPNPDAFGFDPAINAIQITLDGTLASIGTVGAPTFELRLAAQVR
ncbi:MAG: hypothetical protein AAFX10_12810 [Pseudomonadota bacterium]